jgi:hypothetical protein
MQGSGSGQTFDGSVEPGAYTLTATLVETEPAPEVSLSITPSLVVEEDPDASFTATLTVDGEVPEDGLAVYVDVKEVDELAWQFDTFSTEGLEFGPYSDPDNPGVFEFILYESTGSVTLDIFNDVLEEEPFTYNFELLPDVDSVDYVVNPDASTGSFELIDGIGGPGVGPDVGLSLDKTSVAEGEELTVTFHVDGEIPDGGLPIYVDGPAFALSEFVIFDENGDFAITTTGIAGDPAPDEDAGGFFVTLTEDDATITLSVFDDGPNEPSEDFTFELRNGEEYEVDPAASDVTITIDDTPAIPVVTMTLTELATEDASPEIKLTFNVDGEIPEGGLPVTFTGAAFFEPGLLDNNVGLVFDPPDGFLPIGFDGVNITGALLVPTVSLSGFLFDDIIEEAPQELSIDLLPSDDYVIGGDATVTVRIEDGDSVIPGSGPTVGLSVDKTELAEGEALMVTFDVDGAIPEGGLEVYVDGPASALGEFNIFNEDGTPAVVTTGIDGFPAPDNDAGGFFVTLTENQATMTLSVFDDGPNEGAESFTFELVDGEQYEVDPAAGEVGLEIDDGDEQTWFGSTGGDEFEAGLSPEGFNGSNDVAFGGAGDDLFDTSTGHGGNRLFGQSGDDTFFLGSNDNANGGADDDTFYFLGGDTVAKGGAGSDAFWVALGEQPGPGNSILDFEVGTDVIGVALGVEFDDLTLAQDEADTSVGHDGEELVKLLGVTAGDLTESDFALV